MESGNTRAHIIDLSHISEKFEFNVLRRGTFVVIVKMKFGKEMKRLASSQSLLGFTWVSMGLSAMMKKIPIGFYVKLYRRRAESVMILLLSP